MLSVFLWTLVVVAKRYNEEIKTSIDKNKGKIYNDIFVCFVYIFIHWCFISTSMLKSLRALSHTFKNETRIALMQRILSFHGFFIVFWIWIEFSCAYRRGIASSEGKIRKNPCARQAHIIHVHQIKHPWKEQIRCIRAIRVSLNPCCRREAMTIKVYHHKQTSVQSVRSVFETHTRPQRF